MSSRLCRRAAQIRDDTCRYVSIYFGCKRRKAESQKSDAQNVSKQESRSRVVGLATCAKELDDQGLTCKYSHRNAGGLMKRKTKVVGEKESDDGNYKSKLGTELPDLSLK
jgi:hypothetical protein